MTLDELEETLTSLRDHMKGLSKQMFDTLMYVATHLNTEVVDFTKLHNKITTLYAALEDTAYKLQVYNNTRR